MCCIRGRGRRVGHSIPGSVGMLCLCKSPNIKCSNAKVPQVYVENQFDVKPGPKARDGVIRKIKKAHLSGALDVSSINANHHDDVI